MSVSNSYPTRIFIQTGVFSSMEGLVIRDIPDSLASRCIPATPGYLAHGRHHNPADVGGDIDTGAGPLSGLPVSISAYPQSRCQARWQPAPVPPPSPPSTAQELAHQCHARQLVRHQHVWVLHHQGWPGRAIARQLGIGKHTVFRYLRPETFGDPWRLARVTRGPGAAGRSDSTPSLAGGRALNRREGGGDTRRPARPPRGLLPRPPLVATGVLDAERRGERQAHAGVARVEPTRLDEHGQASAGIDGTIARGLRRPRRRRPRSSGLARVRVGPSRTAVGLPGLRRGACFLETSRAMTRLTPVAQLRATAAAASP